MVVLIVAIPVLGYRWGPDRAQQPGREGRRAEPRSHGARLRRHRRADAHRAGRPARRRGRAALGSPCSPWAPVSTGGSVLFVPLDTNLVKPALFVDRLRTAYHASRRGHARRAPRAGCSASASTRSSISATRTGPRWSRRCRRCASTTRSALTVGETVLAGGPDRPPGRPGRRPTSAAGARARTTSIGSTASSSCGGRGCRRSPRAGADAVPTTTNGLGPFISALAAGQTSMATLDVVPSAQPAPRRRHDHVRPAGRRHPRAGHRRGPCADLAGPRRPVLDPGAERLQRGAHPRRAPPGARAWPGRRSTPSATTTEFGPTDDDDRVPQPQAQGDGREGARRARRRQDPPRCRDQRSRRPRDRAGPGRVGSTSPVTEALADLVDGRGRRPPTRSRARTRSCSRSATCWRSPTTS